MEISVGDGAIKWIWENCKGYLLDALTEPMGEDQVKRMILEFRSRLALCDLGMYSNAVKKISNQYFGNKVESEGSHKCAAWSMTPYVETTLDEEGWIIPEERTLPGWTGANIIPLKVEGSDVSITFDSLEEEDMICQLCWRTTDGTPVYSKPFETGKCTVNLDGKSPANGVLFAVVCNRTYKYAAALRKKHFAYKVQVEGAKPASTKTRWFNYDQNLE